MLIEPSILSLFRQQKRQNKRVPFLYYSLVFNFFITALYCLMANCLIASVFLFCHHLFSVHMRANMRALRSNYLFI